jgi:hypothetical protein
MKENLRLKLNTFDMKKQIQSLVLFLVSITLLTGNAMGQRVGFGLYATDNIVLTPLGSGTLNFNTKQNILLPDQTVTINLVDDGAAIITITGRLDEEITVTIDAPSTLDLDVSNTIPLTVKFAYSNTGAATDVLAKLSSVEMAAGFTSATFPIFRRTSGLPAPPPTPGHSGYVAPTGTAYLFLYGTLGAIPSNAAAGIYTGNINVHVSYAK